MNLTAVCLGLSLVALATVSTLFVRKRAEARAALGERALALHQVASSLGELAKARAEVRRLRREGLLFPEPSDAKPEAGEHLDSAPRMAP